MFSVYLLEDFLGKNEQYKDYGSVDRKKTEIYSCFLMALLGYNEIECKTIRPIGLEHDFMLKSRRDDSIIYAPAVFLSGQANISFLYTDSTESYSESFKTASLLRKNRSNDEEGKITFINPLKSTDVLSGFSPILVDIIRVSDDESGSKNDNLFWLACVTAETLLQRIGRPFKIPYKDIDYS